MTGRHRKITLSFLVVGHTKFSPDWCFGLLKQKYRKTKIGSLNGLEAVVEASAECNHSQLVGTNDGTLVVQSFDWTSFFSYHFRRIVGIKKFQHFCFDVSNLGVVIVKEYNDSAETEFRLLKDDWIPNPDVYPDVVTPKGLSLERQWYLYDSIRQFCPEEDKDITCPLPTRPKPVSRSGTPIPTGAASLTGESSHTESPRMAPPAKRLCGTVDNLDTIPENVRVNNYH